MQKIFKQIFSNTSIIVVITIMFTITNTYAFAASGDLNLVPINNERDIYNTNSSTYQHEPFITQKYKNFGNDISSMNIEVDGVDLLFETSSDDSFSAALKYPDKLKTAYHSTDIKVAADGKTIIISAQVPREISSTYQNATLTIQVPRVPLDDVIINNIDSNGSYTLTNPLNNLKIINEGGEFRLWQSSLAKNTVIDTKYGEFYLLFADEPLDLNFSIESITNSGWFLPDYWSCTGFPGEWAKYLVGAGTNKMDITTDTSTVHASVGY